MPETPEKPKRASINAVVPPPPDAKYLNYGEAAYVLRVSVTTIRRAVDHGEFATVSLFGRTLIPATELEDFGVRARTRRIPAPELTPEQIAEAKVKASIRLRSKVKADWNTGEDLLRLDKKPCQTKKSPTP